MTQDIEKIKSFLDFGSDVASSGIGAVIGFLIGDLPGSTAGAVIAPCAKKVLGDIINRVLSTREKLRVANTTTFAIEKIIHNLKLGMKPRDDGFFSRNDMDRSDADEIFEGVLLKAKNEHEEKKTKILGNIFANTAFAEGFTTGEANHLIQITDNLTYRKMCILSVVARKDRISDVKLRKDYYRRSIEITSHATISILQEIYDMYNIGLIASREDRDQRPYPALIGWYDITPDALELTRLGGKYYKMMGLDEIPDQDLREIARYLR